MGGTMVQQVVSVPQRSRFPRSQVAVSGFWCVRMCNGLVSPFATTKMFIKKQHTVHLIYLS